MILNLISLSSVKTQLGIATGTTTYDASISALIPIVSSDIRRMLNCSFDEYVGAAISSGSTQILISTSESYNTLMPVKPRFNLGKVVYNPSLSADTYLSSYDPKTGYYTMSAPALGSSDYIIPSVEIAQFPAISKMIWYRISKQNITNSIARGISSESYGPVSITYSDKEINRQWDYPQVLISDLGIPFTRVG